MKIWVDDMRKAPEGFVHVKSVNEAVLLVDAILTLQEDNLAGFETVFANLNGMRDDDNKLCKEDFARLQIEVIDLDHDAGEFALCGGDYIKIIDWICLQASMGRCQVEMFPLRFHTMNPVGKQNMQRFAEKQGFPVLN